MPDGPYDNQDPPRKPTQQPQYPAGSRPRRRRRNRGGEQVLSIMAHLLGLLTSFIGPLALWLIKRHDDDGVAHHALQALNFQLTILLLNIFLALAYMIVARGGGFDDPQMASAMSSIVMPGWGLVGICNIACSILGTVAASRGERYYYPASIDFMHRS